MTRTSYKPEGVTPLHIEPLTLAKANDLISRWHRHHKSVTGHRFSIGVFTTERECKGAAIVGRPVARRVDQTMVAEVTRLVTDGTPNACSMLYAACARAAKPMGFWWIQTYILQSEPGTSLKASGWRLDGEVAARSWDTPSRRRVTELIEAKQRWRCDLNLVCKTEDKNNGDDD